MTQLKNNMSQLRNDKLSSAFEETSFPYIKDVEKCLQCGKCVGVCPAAKISSFNPRKLIRDVNLGNVEKVLSSRELWTCFFCSACYANCPQDINLPFVVIILRTASLQAEYGVEYVKELLPYGINYYHRGITVDEDENNPDVVEAVARNSGTDGTIKSVRKQLGLPEKRMVSEKALTEIQAIADMTGMTDVLQELPEKEGKPLQWKYGKRRVVIKKSKHGKFLGIFSHDKTSYRHRYSPGKHVFSF